MEAFNFPLTTTTAAATATEYHWSVVVSHVLAAPEREIPLALGQSVVLGRGPPFALEGRFGHKYFSREHIRLTVVAAMPANGNGNGNDNKGDAATQLQVRQLGKNPTFLGHAPPLEIASGATVVIRQEQCVGAGRGSTAGASTLHFPSALGLPSLHVHCRVVAAVAHHRSPQVPMRLVVPPTLYADDDDDDNNGAAPPSAPAPRHLPLLERALTEQAMANRREQQRREQASAYVPPAESAVGFAAPVAPIAAAAIGSAARAGWNLAGAASATKPPAPPPPPPPQSPPRQVSRAIATAAVAAAAALDGESDATPPRRAQSKMGMWEWKARVDGDERDPASWRRYPKAIADILETAFRAGGPGPVPIDATYVVCFADAAHGMVQVRADDSSRWRAVRRRGGDPVARPNTKRVRCVAVARGDSSSSAAGSDDSRPAHDDYDRNDSWLVDDDEDDDDDDDSDPTDHSDAYGDDSSSESSVSSSSSDERRRRRKKKQQKKMKKTKQKQLKKAKKQKPQPKTAAYPQPAITAEAKDAAPTSARIE